MSVHRIQHGQSRTELLLVIRKGLLQHSVDGELRRIEEAVLRDPGELPRRILRVHCGNSLILEIKGITRRRNAGRTPSEAAPPATSTPETRGRSRRDTPWDRRVRSRSRPSGTPGPSGTA